MMTEKYPTWLIGHVKEWAEKRLPTVILCSTTGNELLEVWYYGDLLTVKGEPQSYIVDGDAAPGLVAARDPESGEEFVIFDGGRHGYDNMFCDEHDPSELEHRPLKRYEIPASKLVLELGYNAVQTGAAHHVDGDSRGLDGQASLQSSLTSDVLAQTGLNDAAHVDMIDLLGSDVCTVQSFLDDDGAQLNCGNVCQSAAELANSGTACRCDNDLFHVNSLLNCVCVTFRKPFLSKRP